MIKESSFSNMTLVITIGEEEIRIPAEKFEKIKFGDVKSLTTAHVRDIADLADKFAAWAWKMKLENTK